ncbi:MAG: sodium-independent anion transporter [Anaerolineaceae bacterium 4572_78]|nr:MAG: sodium-independent anion transporter [Anaerolineaceae bacterium 4572_78]
MKCNILYRAFLSWVRTYHLQDLIGDILGGIIVAIMLVPQGMAYALLAGLPPEVGLYSSIVALIIYGLLGSSRVLSVGPVAVVSLLVATGISPVAKTGSAEYLEYAIVLALLVGIIQVMMGLARVGFLVNFLSHPVISGFINAVAIIIGGSQLKHLLGIEMPHTEYFYLLILYILTHISTTNFVTLIIGLVSIGVLVYFKTKLGSSLEIMGLSPIFITPITKTAPLIIIISGTLLVALFDFNQIFDVKIVGNVPIGLPSFTLPIIDIDVWKTLLPTAFIISLVSYIESVSVAEALAIKRRQKINPNQELFALGIANLGATLVGGYPVTGSFSRSAVNEASGASTRLSSIITAILIAITIVLFTPLFYYLPTTVLAAIIIVAVYDLIDIETPKQLWIYSKGDAISLAITFITSLAIGVEMGILAGIFVSVILLMWRTSHPHIVIVGRIGQGQIYRNVKRYQTTTYPEVLAVRVDTSLYFTNTRYLEDQILHITANRPEIKHFILIGSAINFIDSSALDTLGNLQRRLDRTGVEFHLAGMKGDVMDRLERVGFLKKIGTDHIHLTVHEAMKTLNFIN